jgi:hypothetical protein
MTNRAVWSRVPTDQTISLRVRERVALVFIQVRTCRPVQLEVFPLRSVAGHISEVSGVNPPPKTPTSGIPPDSLNPYR